MRTIGKLTTRAIRRSSSGDARSNGGDSSSAGGNASWWGANGPFSVSIARLQRARQRSEACVMNCWVVLVRGVCEVMDRPSCRIDRSSSSLASEPASCPVSHGDAATPVASHAMNVGAAPAHGDAGQTTRDCVSASEQAASAFSGGGRTMRGASTAIRRSSPAIRGARRATRGASRVNHGARQRNWSAEFDRGAVLVPGVGLLMRCSRCTIRSLPRTVRSPSRSVRCTGRTAGRPRSRSRSPDGRQRGRRRRFRFI